MQSGRPNSNEFPTIFGRNLVAELPAIAHRPYLVVTMPEIWPKFRQSFHENLVGPYFVSTNDGDKLIREFETIPRCGSVIGLGGGRVIDVAKYIAWQRRIPLFQVPTVLTVDAPFRHRAGLRFSGQSRSIGWAVPEAVYIDYDVVRGAPLHLNRSGVSEALCFHTATADWRLARDRNKTEPKWPYDQQLADESLEAFNHVMAHLNDIRDMTDHGIRTLVSAMRWAGASYQNSGWVPCHLEGVEHFVCRAFEHGTGKQFVHGQLVCFGVVVGSLLHRLEADELLAAIHRVGVDIRPESMGLSWAEVKSTLLNLKSFVHQAGFWYSIAHETDITPDWVTELHARVTEHYGPWQGEAISPVS